MWRILLLLLFSLHAIAAENKSTPVTFKPLEAVEAPLSIYGILAGLLVVALVAVYLKYRVNSLAQYTGTGEEPIAIITKKRLSTRSTLFVIREGNKRICFIEQQQGIAILTITQIHDE